VKVKLSARARTATRRIDEWWQAERPEAPDAFVEELERAIALLAGAPEMGIVYGSFRNRPLRRLLLEKTRYHLYYVIVDERIEVVTVWSALRGRQPRFANQ